MSPRFRRHLVVRKLTCPRPPFFLLCTAPFSSSPMPTSSHVPSAKKRSNHCSTSMPSTRTTGGFPSSGGRRGAVRRFKLWGRGVAGGARWRRRGGTRGQCVCVGRQKGGGGAGLEKTIAAGTRLNQRVPACTRCPLGRAFLPPSGRHRIPVLPLLACFVLRRFLMLFVHRQKPQSTTFRAFILLPRGPFKRRRALPFAPLLSPS